MDFTGGCGGAARGRASARGARGEEKQRGSERASAPASAGVGGRVGTGAGRLRRAAASTAHGRHAAGKLCRGRARGAARQRACARRQASAALGWAGPRRGARRCGMLAGPASAVGQKRGGGPRMRKTLFHLYFQEIFKHQLSNIILSKKMISFENVPKMKVD